ncbi:MAG: hypothetical protein WCW65_03545 [Candidatus Paceibacterota bacterium]
MEDKNKKITLINMNYKNVAKTLRDTARDQLRTEKISALQADLVMLDVDLADAKKDIETVKERIAGYQYNIDKVALDKKAGLKDPQADKITKRMESAIVKAKKSIENIEKDILELRKNKVEVRKAQAEYADGTKKFNIEKINNVALGLIAEFFKAKGIHDGEDASKVKAELTEEEVADEKDTAALVSDDDEDKDEYEESDE